MPKHLNYGLDKSTFEPDKSRINWDYIKGIIDTDGCVVNKKEIGNYRVVISQNHPSFLLALKEFIEREKNIVGNIYMNGTQLCFYDKDLLNFINTYIPIDYDSYYAGIIDGDGSFCSHKSSSGVYWRFIIGASKERKIIIFNNLINYYKLKSIIWSNKKTQVTLFGVQGKEDLIKLLNKIGNKLIVKQYIGDIVLQKLLDKKKELMRECKYCKEMFERAFKNNQMRCNKIECKRKLKRDNMRKIRALRKLKLFKTKVESTQIQTEGIAS